MPEVIDAIRDNGLALVALVLVSGFLVSVLRLFYRELKDRIARAEALVDDLGTKFDRAIAVADAALNELRKP